MDKNHRRHFCVFLQDTVVIEIDILVQQVVIFTSFIMSFFFGISFLEQIVILVEINKIMRFDKTVFCRLPPEGITFFTHLKSRNLNLSLANIQLFVTTLDDSLQWMLRPLHTLYIFDRSKIHVYPVRDIKKRNHEFKILQKRPASL